MSMLKIKNFSKVWTNIYFLNWWKKFKKNSKTEDSKRTFHIKKKTYCEIIESKSTYYGTSDRICYYKPEFYLVANVLSNSSYLFV